MTIEGQEGGGSMQSDLTKRAVVGICLGATG